MSDVDYIEDDYDEPCPNCGGDGVIEDCCEDTCVCLDPPCCTQVCDWCNGKG